MIMTVMTIVNQLVKKGASLLLYLQCWWRERWLWGRLAPKSCFWGSAAQQSQCLAAAQLEHFHLSVGSDPRRDQVENKAGSSSSSPPARPARTYHWMSLLSTQGSWQCFSTAAGIASLCSQSTAPEPHCGVKPQSEQCKFKRMLVGYY